MYNTYNSDQDDSSEYRVIVLVPKNSLRIPISAVGTNQSTNTVALRNLNKLALHSEVFYIK